MRKETHSLFSLLSLSLSLGLRLNREFVCPSPQSLFSCLSSLVSPLFSLLLFLVACYCWPFSPVQQVVGLSKENGCFFFFSFSFCDNLQNGDFGFCFWKSLEDEVAMVLGIKGLYSLGGVVK